MKKNLMNGEDRASYGVLVSFMAKDGRRLVLRENGPVYESIRLCCERALLLDDTFRITAMSSPEYIWRDLVGRGKRNTHDSAGTPGAAIPEPQLLAVIGMPWMLHPSLLQSTAKLQMRP